MNELQWTDATKDLPFQRGVAKDVVVRVIGCDAERRWVREVYYSTALGWHNCWNKPEIVTHWMYFPEFP